MALVLEMGENGLGVVRSLARDARIGIIGIGRAGSPAFYSRFLAESHALDVVNDDSVLEALREINDRYELIVPFATGNDFWVRMLWEHRNELPRFLTGFSEGVVALMQKTYHRDIARELGIPYPNSCRIRNTTDLAGLECLRPPFIVKPEARNTRQEAFRLKVCMTASRVADTIASHVGSCSFLVSEYIQGGDEQLYTFGSCSRDGEILRSFIGRKLSQVPRRFGTAGIVEMVDDAPVVEEYGRCLIAFSRFSGISQVEFKRDRRDGKFYLIEINPRSWKWIHLGTLAGSNLPLTYYRAVTRTTIRHERTRLRKRYWVCEEFLRYSTVVDHDIRWFPWLLAKAMTGRVGFSLWDRRDRKPFKIYCRNAGIGLSRRLTSAISRRMKCQPP